MPKCPACLGEGNLDLTDLDAAIGEQFSDAEIERLKDEHGLVHPVGVITCDECEGTGVVSEQRALELRAFAVAAVDQIFAEYDAKARRNEGGTR